MFHLRNSGLLSGFVRDRDDSSCSFSDWSDTESSDGDSVVAKGVISLLDLAASVTAKHYACDQLEQQGFPLDEILLKKVRKNVINFLLNVIFKISILCCTN